MIDLSSSGLRRAAFVFFLLFTMPTLWLALRTYSSFQLLRSAYAARAPATSSIRAWMTLKFVADTYRISAPALIDRLSLSRETDPNSTLKSIAAQARLSPYQYVQRVQHAVAELGAHNGTAGVNETSGWLATFGDEVLSAMLVYGYPILGSIQLAGAIGAPVPDGIAGTVAGSLAAQGRMNWIVAGIVIVVGSVLGDLIGYGIGRLLSRNFLDRHGRWLGYTRGRGAKVEGLFARWGLITVFVTRTFVSYLGSVANLLAGVSHYRLSKFFIVSVMGRVIWASAYLGLGYVIGANFEAATGFLTNLSGFLLSATALVVAGWIAMISKSDKKWARCES
jgi:membrane protein DedA with SNARE-associated domain